DLEVHPPKTGSSHPPDVTTLSRTTELKRRFVRSALRQEGNSEKRESSANNGQEGREALSLSDADGVGGFEAQREDAAWDAAGTGRLLKAVAIRGVRREPAQDRIRGARDQRIEPGVADLIPPEIGDGGGQAQGQILERPPVEECLERLRPHQ